MQGEDKIEVTHKIGDGFIYALTVTLIIAICFLCGTASYCLKQIGNSIELDRAAKVGAE